MILVNLPKQVLNSMDVYHTATKTGRQAGRETDRNAKPVTLVSINKNRLKDG